MAGVKDDMYQLDLSNLSSKAKTSSVILSWTGVLFSDYSPISDVNVLPQLCDSESVICNVDKLLPIQSFVCTIESNNSHTADVNT